MKSHVELSPSKTAQWWHCPGSVAAQRGLPDDTSEWAEEGTAAHALAELAWTEGKSAAEYLNVGIEVKRKDADSIHIVVDHEMADAVQVLLDAYTDAARNAERVWTEQFMSLDALKPPAPMGGTVDFCVWKDRWLHVIDFKYGRGVVVEAIDNKQGRSYALAAWMKLIADTGVAVQPDGVRVTIVQPRAFHREGPVRSEDVLLPEFKQWAKHLMQHAKAALEPAAPRVPGDHCRFCKFKAECPELRAAGLSKFEVVTRTSVQTLTGEALAGLLAAADLAEEAIKALRARAAADLEAGRPVPGYMLEERKGHRKFTNFGAVVACLDAYGVPEGEMYAPRELLSPAQLSKVAKRHKATIPADLIVQPITGRALVRRPDALPPSAPAPEFETVTRP